MDQQEYIDELIIKCLSGEAGVDESKELSRWMDADKEHLAYFLKMKMQPWNIRRSKGKRSMINLR